jgi:hypothetical protein
MAQSIESRFEIFSSEWLDRCGEYKKMAISEDMADQIQKELENDLYFFRVQAGITREETGDLEKGIRQLQKYVELALAKGKANPTKEASGEKECLRAPLRDIMAGLHKK